MKLLEKEDYHQKNHILFTDNWFTSFEQLDICMRRGIHMVGTVRQKRKGIPFSFKTNHGQRQHRQRGDFTTVRSDFYISETISDTVYYTAWLDRKHWKK
jgi:Transposase IS4